MPPRSPRKSPNTARDLHAAHAHAALRGDGTCDSLSDTYAVYALCERTASSSSRMSLSAVGMFFTLNWIPTRHKRSGQDATHGWPLRKSEIVVFHILVCTRCMCLQHCTVMARVTPALESNSHRVCPA